MRSVSVSLVKGVLDYLTNCGVDADKVAASVDLVSLEDISDVDVSHYLALLDALTRELCDEAAVLRYARDISMPQISLLGVIMEGASDMAQALSELQAFSSLAYSSDDDAGAIQFYQGEHGDWIALGHIGQHRYLAEESVTRLVMGPRRFLSRDHVLAATFSYPAPAYWREYQQILNCTVEFDAEHTGILVPPDLGSWPVAQLPKPVTELLRRKAQSEIDALRRQSLVTAQVAELIRIALPERAPTAEVIAQALHCSRSTLARSLKSEGTSFAALLWQARLSIAQDLLMNSDCSIDVISAKLSYSEPSAFVRAFKAHMGVTPLAYRTLRGLTT